MESQMKSMTPQELKQKLSNPDALQLIDVREPAEFRSEKLSGFSNLPLSNLDQTCGNLSPEKPVVLLCRSGNRAGQAGKKLEQRGLKNLWVVAGGIEACKSAGFAVETTSSRIWSLDRQVRFTAGTLVLSGIVLSMIIHPAWLGLSLFVGAGLVFSAVTDTCGMAMMLAKMPWNQCSQKTCSR